MVQSTSGNSIETIRGIAWRVIRTSLIILLPIFLGLIMLGRAPLNLSVAFGNLIALSSFLLLAFMISMMLGRSGLVLALLFFMGLLKLSVITITLWWTISRNLVDPLAFLAGFSTMVLALIIEGSRLNTKRAAQPSS